MKLKLHFFFSLLYKNKVRVFICFTFLFLSCKKENTSGTIYKSNFIKRGITSFPELEYWASNTKEWQVFQDRIECLVSNENRKIHLLTRQLGSQEGNLEMKVRLGFLNNKISNLNKNWAGFHFGNQRKLIKDDLNNQNKGINIGVTTNGTLFIGSPCLAYKNSIIMDALKNGVDLKILIENNNSSYTIDFSVLEISTGKILGRISKSNIVSEQITGDFTLVSNFVNQEVNIENLNKSVWFQNWEIKGSKVALP